MTHEIRLYAVLGSPIAHSLSPRLHNFAFQQRRMSGCYYVPVLCQPHQLVEKLEAFRSLGGVGVNLTRPLKETVLPYLARRSRWVEATGAANTLAWTDSGWVGDNTDVQALLGRLPAAKPSGAPALVLGSGGAARSSVVALRMLGYEPTVAARRPEAVDFCPAVIPWAALSEPHPWAVVINATPLGQSGEAWFDRWPAWGPGTVAVDWVYQPRQTAFLTQAASAGCRVVDGLALLVDQARYAWVSWFGEMGPASMIEAVAEQASDDAG